MSTAIVADSPTPSLAPLAATASTPEVARAPEGRRVSIADRVARAFSPLACVRGYRAYARHEVALSKITDRMLEADIKGKRTQHVRLVVEDGRLAAACSCAAKVLGPVACRHVWAALLEVDRQALLPSLRTLERSLALASLEAPRAPRKAGTPSEGRPATAKARTAAPGAKAEATKASRPKVRARKPGR